MIKLILLALLFPCLCLGQHRFTDQFNKFTDAHVSAQGYAGTVLVAQKGKVIYQRAMGKADLEWNIPNAIDTRFQIGSITKQFTAACILQLAEQGKLNLDDKLSKYFPRFPKGDSVTIHMLLNHTSGIKSYTSMSEFWNLAPVPTTKDTMVALMSRYPYDFSPGTKWDYNNSGFFLLGYIIEKVSGKTYSEYLQQHIFQKAGLYHTMVNRWDTVLEHRAKGYDKTPSGWRNAMYISMEGPYAAGAMISNVEDLKRWNDALFSHKIISNASLQKMTTAYMEHYGYGIGVDTFQNHLRIGHSGGIPGFLSYLAYFPKEDITVVALSNTGGNTVALATGLFGIMAGISVAAPYKHQAITIDTTTLDRFTGQYAVAPSDTLQIIKRNSKLYRKTTMSELELKPESATRFFYDDDSDRWIDFTIDEGGKVSAAYLVNEGFKYPLKRL
jgi:CubicO group peptidase (beta-lactamase class C family)